MYNAVFQQQLKIFLMNKRIDKLQSKVEKWEHRIAMADKQPAFNPTVIYLNSDGYNVDDIETEAYPSDEIEWNVEEAKLYF